MFISLTQFCCLPQWKSMLGRLGPPFAMSTTGYPAPSSRPCTQGGLSRTPGFEIKKKKKLGWTLHMLLTWFNLSFHHHEMETNNIFLMRLPWEVNEISCHQIFGIHGKREWRWPQQRCVWYQQAKASLLPSPISTVLLWSPSLSLLLGSPDWIPVGQPHRPHSLGSNCPTLLRGRRGGSLRIPQISEDKAWGLAGSHDHWQWVLRDRARQVRSLREVAVAWGTVPAPAPHSRTRIKPGADSCKLKAF